jgi:hypothetical protein
MKFFELPLVEIHPHNIHSHIVVALNGNSYYHRFAPPGAKAIYDI